MALIKTQRYAQDALVLVWHLTETHSDLDSMGLLIDFKGPAYPTEYGQVMAYVKQELIYQLGVELSVSSLLLNKDTHGKPHLKGENHGHISISHNKDYYVLAYHPFKPIGVDVEKARPQLFNVLHRVCASHELAFIKNNLQLATTVWCIKEALYKLYGRRGLIFKENLISDFKESVWTAELKLENSVTTFPVIIEHLNSETQLVLVF